MDCNITTTAGEKFDYRDHVLLARLIFKRFGKDPEQATAAWRRMLENSATVSDFMRLAEATDEDIGLILRRV